MKVSTILLRWYDKHGRDLPWRSTRDPYRILVSEIMLQQTQVDRVKRYYQAWLKHFPNWQILSEAGNPQVIKAWSGLGYNRRALALRDIAKQVVKEGVPQNREEWLKLKGIGPYTSAAVALFSNREKVFPVDTVIRRVGGRLFLGKPYASNASDSKIESAGLKLLNKTNRFSDIPQALFDLGSNVCSKVPKCHKCRLQSVCKAASGFLSGKTKAPKRSVFKGFERIHHGKRYPDRIYRGLILKIVQDQARGITLTSIATIIDPGFDKKKDGKWLESMVNRMVKDGFITIKQGRLFLKQ